MATQFLIKLGLKFDIYDLWSRALLWSVQPWADRSAESIPSNEWLGSSNLSYLWESFNRWNAHCTNNSDYYLYKSYSQKLRIQEPRYYGVFFFFSAELALWPGEESGNHRAKDRSLTGTMGVGVDIDNSSLWFLSNSRWVRGHTISSPISL